MATPAPRSGATRSRPVPTCVPEGRVVIKESQAVDGPGSTADDQAPLIVLGAGGNLADILDIVDAMEARGERVALPGLLDDSRPVGSTYRGLPVLGPLADWRAFPSCRFISSIRNQETHHRH